MISVDVHGFFLSIPLLFIGLFMAIDPSGFVRVLNDLAIGIQRFSEELRFGWRSTSIAQFSASPSLGVRLVGIALTGVAVSYLVASVLRQA